VRHVAALAEEWVAEGVTPALVVLVARRGLIVLHEAFGRLTPEPDSPPVQRDTIYSLASITKPITATAAMILVEEGLLSLNRPVAEYLPEFAGEGKDAVMVHHLLTHTSGLRDEDVDAHAAKKRGTVEIPPTEETQHPSVHERLFLGCDAPLWKSPGVEMAYCSFGYRLLGEIVRRVSGQSLAEFARERIFEPLGMEDTSISCRTRCDTGSSGVLQGHHSPGGTLATRKTCLRPTVESIRRRGTWRSSGRCSSTAAPTGTPAS
jgi:CubicO group peptidase (beta-lactamase class C family)